MRLYCSSSWRTLPASGPAARCCSSCAARNTRSWRSERACMSFCCELALGAIHDRHVDFGQLGQLAVVGALEVRELGFELRHVRADALGFLGIELGGVRRAALALAAMLGEERADQPLRTLLRLRRHAVVVRQRECVDDLALAAGARIENGRGDDLHADVAPQPLEHGATRRRRDPGYRSCSLFSLRRLASVSTMPLRFCTYWSA